MSPLKQRAPRQRGKLASLDYSCLESRRLLAGTVSAIAHGNNLFLVGDQLANDISIIQRDNGTVLVQGTDTRINRSDQFVFRGDLKNLTVRMLGGNDSISLTGIQADKNLKIDLGGGHDRAEFTSVMSRDARVWGGRGNDVIDINGLRTRRSAYLYTGANDDVVAIDVMRAGRDLRVFTGSGNDLFSADRLSVVRNLTVNMASGNDQLLFAGQLIVNRNTNLFLGAGNDRLFMVPEKTSNVARVTRLNLQAGAGNDAVVLDSEVTLRGRARIDGGRGRYDSIQNDARANSVRDRAFEFIFSGDLNQQVDQIYSGLEAAGIDSVDFGAIKLGLDPLTQFVTVNDPTPTVSVLWDVAAQQAVASLGTGPTIASRAYAMVHTAMFDAWSAYDQPAASTQLADDLQRPDNENTESNKRQAMSYAAYQVLVDLFPTEIEIFRDVMDQLGYDTNNSTTDTTTAAGIGNRMAAALLEFRHNDGANQLGDEPAGTAGVAYSSTVDYLPVNEVGNLVDIAAWTPESVAVSGGGTQLQTFLTPQWGEVTAFGLDSGDQVRPTAPEPFLLVEGTVDFQNKTITVEGGTPVEITKDLVGTVINPAFIEQSEHVIELSANLTDRQKLIAEFWEDGGGTSFPPGTWMTFGQYTSARDNHSTDQDAKLFFALGNAVFDAGVATWEAKTFFDYTRPFRAIRELGRLGLIGEFDSGLGGYAIDALVQGSGTQRILATDFSTYQTPGSDPSPPFAEYTSGHSAFSAAGAEVLLRFTNSDYFGADVTFQAGESRFEPGQTPGVPTTLAWSTFSLAADEAGVSRLYGGIHFTEGDVNGRTLGREVGMLAWEKAQFFISGAVRS